MNKTRLNKIRKILLVPLFLLPAGLIYWSGPAEKIQDIPLSYRADPLKIHGISQDFARIPSGEFMMGSDDRPEERPVHPVKVESFDISTTEVTVLQFRAFVQATCYVTDAETNGSSFACCWRPKLGINWRNPGFLQADNEPVVAISWNDAVAYCKWISSETGEKYRLPSEAEWEYACKTGEEPAKDRDIGSTAWYSENSDSRTHQVGTKRCNKYGLFDMRGNAWEWTEDVYHNNYTGAPSTGEPWTTGGAEEQGNSGEPGGGRVLRGGAWGLWEKMHPVSYDLRITSRPVFGKDNSCNNSGFRLARSTKPDIAGGIIKGNQASSFFSSGIEYDLVWLPAGQFMMGDGEGGRESKPFHKVYFRYPFGIGKTEITVKQFRSFTDATGYISDAEKNGNCWDSDFRSRHTSVRQKGMSWKNPGFVQTDNDPVTCITWNDAMAFCKWLSSQTDRIIRLPSEAEWEYAMCGKPGMNDNLDLNESAWYYNNSGFTTHPVGQKSPNENGIYDLLGNVSEWTADVWHPDYSGAPDDGSSWLGIPVKARVIRGGSFEREANEMGPRARDWYDESEPVAGAGFRIVCLGISD